MKIRNLALILVASAVSSAIYAAPVVMIKNEYKDPIIVMIDGSNAALLQTGQQERLNSWPNKIQIRTQKTGSAPHSGIQREVEKIKQEAQGKPNLYATITILNANNPFHFEYRTDMQQAPSRPGSSPTKPSQNQNQQSQSLFEQMLKAQNIEPLVVYVYSNRPSFPITAQKLELIMNAIYDGTNQNNAPMNHLSRAMLDSIYKVTAKNMNEYDFYAKEIPSVISQVYNNMVVASRTPGKVRFKAGITITPQQLETLRTNSGN